MKKETCLHNDLIYIHEGNKTYEAGYKLKQFVAKYSIEVFAIGDGTAGRETEQLVKGLQPKFTHIFSE
jgi:uncharacterized protein